MEAYSFLFLVLHPGKKAIFICISTDLECAGLQSKTTK
jgi:hypothetical protein